MRGRPKEVATLKKLYHDCGQVSKVVIIEGKAGVGKTALITSQQTHFFNYGHFVTGTFSQQRSSEPFSAIADALHDLFEELLSEEYSLDDNSIVKQIMERFQAESKNDAGMRVVLQNALPKFNDLIQVAKNEQRLQTAALDFSTHSTALTSKKFKAKKAASPASVSTKARNTPNRNASGYKKGWNFEKLKISLRLLLRCICSPKRKVVLFLDDLQYADPSSLELIEFLASGDGLSPVPNKDGVTTDEDELDRVQGLLLILAYRNVCSDGKKDGITIDHPFRTRMKELKQLKCPIHRIHVKDLELEAVNSIVAGVMRYQNKPETTVPLSEVVHKKTGGNPFAVLQMLEFLEHAELLYFCLQDYAWKWKNVRTIHSATDLSDTMADMVVTKLQKLPPATQQILMIASCLGSYFRLEVVAAYFRKYNREFHKVDFAAAAAQAAVEALEENTDALNGSRLNLKPMNDNPRKSVMSKAASGLMNNMITLLELPLQQDVLTKRRKSTTYFFAHDRLQNAAYSLVPDDGGKTKKEIHWRLGKLMKEKSQMFPEEHWMAYLATDQLNRGLIFLHDVSERVELAQMNLHIAYMSQEKSAFCPAAEFLRAAIRLVFEDHVQDPLPKTNTKANPSPSPTNLYKCSPTHCNMVWKNYYELCLDMFSMLAEMEYLLGNHMASKQAVDEVIQHALSEEDKFRAQVIFIESISAQRDFEAAIDTCLKILTAYEMKLSANPMKLQVMAEKKRVNKMLEQQIQQDQEDKSDREKLESTSTTFSMNGSISSSGLSTRSQPVLPATAKPNTVSRIKSAGMPSLTKPNTVSRMKSVGMPKNESRFPGLPKNEGRFRKVVSNETAKLTKIFHKKQEQAMMTLPKMTDDKSLRISKLLSQLMLNAILSGKTELSAYVGLRSIRFSFQNGISPHSPMALAAYGISQAKEGKYGEAYANGMLALKLLEVADSKEWHTRTILKCHNLRHIKKPFHESLDPLMEGYRTGIEAGDMEYALVAAMQYSLLYMFVGLPLMPLEPDLMAFAEQVHRYHLPFVLEVAFYIYREYVLDLQGVEHDKISLDDNDDTVQSMDTSMTSGTSSVGVVLSESAIDKRARPLIEREMCMTKLQKHYLFGEYEEAEKMMNLLNDLPKFDYSVLRTINRDTFFGLVNMALAKTTGKKTYRIRGRKFLDEFEVWVKNGSLNSHHIYMLLQAEDAALSTSTDWSKVTKAYDEAIKSAGRSGFTNHEALSNERAGRYLSDLLKSNKNTNNDRAISDAAKAYISRAMALYREWGAKAKVEQLESHFPQLQPSALMQGSNIKARRRFSRGLTARFRDMKLHSGRWSVGASSDLKILDGFDELKENGNGGGAVDSPGIAS